jgi:hypothetical protein
MNLDNVTQYATEVLALVLIFRLLRLREARNAVYSIFVAFLAVQLLGTSAYFICDHWHQFDYRMVWFTFTAVLAVFSLLLAYSLAKAVLAELPGILRFSRMFLNGVFSVAILIAFSTSKSEYWLTPAKNLRARSDQLIYVFIVAEKGISLAAVIVLIAILAFILWFPVKMSKNLALFSIGLAVYFASKAAVKLLSIYTPASTGAVLDQCLSGCLILCFVYWLVFITAQGRLTDVRLGHGWHKDEQEKLLVQLEALNGALLRSSQQLRSSQRMPL